MEAREVRGIPLWLLRDYLVGLGGKAESDGSVAGDGWHVRLVQIEDYTIGSLNVGQVRLEFAGDDEAVARIQELLEPKLLRAGG